VAISTAAGYHYNQHLISDGSGGVIITWQDNRSGNYDIYAQRVNGSGAVQWTADGVAISTAMGEQGSLQLISDGSGGAIIAWQDIRSGTDYDIYAQRVNGSGAAQWTADGVAISTAMTDQLSPQLISDGSGGAIIAWQDYRNMNSDIYAQRVNGSGAAQWTEDGVAISTAMNDQLSHQLIPDGSGGAIITWQDFRSGTYSDIYAQRVNSSGEVQWTPDGVAVSTAASYQYYPQLIPDGSGGAIITWQDFRSGTNSDIYAQRVNSSGAVQWTADDVAISSATGDQQHPHIVSNGSGGAIIVWDDYRSGTNNDIYAQRVNSSGAVQWTANGVDISTAASYQQYPQLISDGSGGAIITWQDRRSGTNYDIYAQRVNSTGAVQWTADGVAISTATDNQYYPSLFSDGSGGAVITWDDHRSGNFDIYAQGVSASGRQ